MSQIVVSGGTGFVGRALVKALLARGDVVTVLTRNQSRVDELFMGKARSTHWDSGHGVVSSLGAMDVVVHLAGSQAVGVRWTREVKAEMIASRVMKAERLVQAMKQATRLPQVLICASGVGYYGAHEASVSLDESSPPGSDFLAKLCVDWENAAMEAAKLGVRVVCARFGIVLGKNGGALKEMVKPFKLMMGGPIGDGKQIVSWVHVDDLIGMVLTAMDDPTISGPVNITSPNPVSNAQLMEQIGLQMKRKSRISVPSGILRWRFGEGADPLLTGQRVLPKVMQQVGYQWKYPDITSALTQAMGKSG
jgi:uncharacterized protein (TIGR01777 family)